MLTNFPYGVSSFGFPLIGSGPVLSTGQVFFVNSSTGIDADGRGVDSSTPFKSIAYAVSKCSSNKGDVVFVMPGHAENLTAATSLAVNGVSIIGIGNGAERPTITLSAATAAGYTVDAENVKISNILFDMTGITGVVAAISVAKKNCTIYGCEFLQSATALISVQAIKLTNVAASWCSILSCKFRAPVTGGVAAIYTGVAVDRLRVEDCEFDGFFSAAPINCAVIASTNLRFQRNFFISAAASIPIIVCFTGSTGMAAYNLLAATTLAAGGLITGDAIWKFQNYAVDTIASSALVEPAPQGVI